MNKVIGNAQVEVTLAQVREAAPLQCHIYFHPKLVLHDWGTFLGLISVRGTKPVSLEITGSGICNR